MTRRIRRMLFLLVAATLALSGCGAKVDNAFIESLNERLHEAEVLYDAADWPGAAKRFSALLADYRQKRQEISDDTALALRERVLLPFYDWAGVTAGSGGKSGENDDDQLIGNPLWADQVITEQYQKNVAGDRQRKADFLAYSLDSALELMERNSLYRYYRRAMEAGEDIYSFDELPYTHDKVWEAFSETLLKKYPIELTDGFTWQGGKKLVICDDEHAHCYWRDTALYGISTMDLATRADEAGYVLRFHEELVPLDAAWVNKSSGNVMKQYYRSDITITLEDLSTGEARVLHTCSASPSHSTLMQYNSSYGTIGRHENQYDTLCEHVFPEIEGIVHVFAKEAA